MKRIEITQPMQDALDTIARVGTVFVPGRDSYSMIEIPKLALADAVLAAVASQERRTDDRQARMATVPKAHPVAVGEVALRPKRRRA